MLLEDHTKSCLCFIGKTSNIGLSSSLSIIKSSCVSNYCWISNESISDGCIQVNVVDVLRLHIIIPIELIILVIVIEVDLLCSWHVVGDEIAWILRVVSVAVVAIPLTLSSISAAIAITIASPSIGIPSIIPIAMDKR